MSENFQLKLSEDVCYQENEDGVVMVYVQEQGMVHMVNNVAGYIIKKCEVAALSIEEIIDSICADFADVSKEMVEADVNQIVEQFLKVGILSNESK